MLSGAGRANDEQPAGGRVFFSGAARSLVEEDEIELTTVGVDIGSSTSHMLFSHIVLERLDTRYIVAERKVLFESDILLTPYERGEDIDAAALSGFIEEQYAAAGIAREMVDTGALILTGVAVRRRNARRIGEMFAAEAGRFVAVSAGDELETVMSAHGSGALALSERTGRTVTNIDIGGGTAKIAVCVGGRVADTTVVEAGARLIAFDAAGRIARLEPFGARYLADLGIDAGIGDTMEESDRARVAEAMAARILAAARGEEDDAWLRIAPLSAPNRATEISFSGGVAEYLYAREGRPFDDLGPAIADAIRGRLATEGVSVGASANGIRATVLGASQYSVQVSGSTIFLDPEDVLPVRNLPVVKLERDLAPDAIDPAGIASALGEALRKFGLDDGARPVAVAIPWAGSASYGRLDALARGLKAGLAPVLEAGHPLAMVIDGDIGGLLGMHMRENGLIDNAIVSVDGIELSAFDFIDIGEVIRATGSVPVVIKSLVFPDQ